MASTSLTSTELRGLALPANRNPGGPFASCDPYDVAWGDLLRAVLVPRGGQVMRRRFGSSLFDMLGEPLDVEDTIVAASIRDSAAQSCPHIVIRDVTLKYSARAIEVGIVFSLKTDPTNEVRRSVAVPKTAISIPGVS